MKKVCIITCYKDPDYVRAVSLRAALNGLDDAETQIITTLGANVVIIKNTHRGLIRYLEVPLKILIARIKQRPDVYLLTFRGYELLPVTRAITIGKPLIFDEFINPIEWTAYEHHKLRENSLAFKVIFALYRLMLKTVRVVLSDTRSHAAYSAKLMRLPPGKFAAVPVGTDEELFAYKPEPRSRGRKEPLTVFYYGNMLPLHGLSTVIEAAKKLKDKPLTFRIIGGDTGAGADVAEAIKEGARIDYDRRVPIKQIAKEASQASVCLGGPFGGTLQAGMVITGKTYQFLSLGRPVVVGANKESSIFTDKKNAIVVKQANADALAEALEWSARHRQQLEAIGKEGRALFEKEFSVEVIRSKLSQILDRV